MHLRSTEEAIDYTASEQAVMKSSPKAVNCPVFASFDWMYKIRNFSGLTF
jgi:hypothetical protein